MRGAGGGGAGVERLMQKSCFIRGYDETWACASHDKDDIIL